MGLVLVTLFGATEARAQRAYHFSPAGSDAAGDGSADRPWATLARANALDLSPGDSLLFEGGKTFRGQLSLGPEDAGTPARPVLVTSYGAGRAVLDAGHGTGVSVYNAGGVDIRALVVRGSGVPTNTGTGVSFYTDLPGDVKLEHVRISDVEVSGFGKQGVSVGGWSGRSGFRDVRVEGVSAHANGDGMSTYAQETGGIEDLYVGRSRFYGNPGRAGASTPTGSGLVVSGVHGALVERNLAYGNGADNTHSAGPVGIWAYEADSVVVRHNESYANRTRGGDGGGFDLDGGVTNSVMEYNYSHDNDGAGFGLFQYAGASPSGGNVVRYNVSENDGRKNGYGAISVWGASSSDPVGSADVYHNTVFVAPAASGTPSAVEVKNGNHRGLTLRNNLLVTTGGLPLVKGPTSRNARFEGNAYGPSGAALAIRWGGTTYRSLEAWRSATGQERLGSEDVGTDADPLLEAPGTTGTVGDPDALHTLTAYRLRPGSPVATVALDLVRRFGADPAPSDFFGTPLGPLGGRSVGAHEAEPPDPPAPSDAPVTTASGPVEAVDSAVRAIAVAGLWFRLTDQTAVATSDGSTVEAETIGVGVVVDVRGVSLPDGSLRADSIWVQGRSTATPPETPSGPREFAVAGVSPNPATSRATLALDLPADAEVSVTVYDLLGRAVLRLPPQSLAAGAGRLVRLDPLPLSPGAYLLRVTAVESGRAATARLTIGR